MSFDFKNPTFLVSVAGVALTAFAVFATRSGAGSTSTTTSGSDVSSADLTSQVNNVNSNAAAVTTALLGAQTTLGTSAVSSEANIEADTLSSGSQYATYDSSARAGVVTNAMQLGSNELATIENGMTSRYATAASGSAADYGTEVNALTSEYGDSAAVMGAEIGGLSSEFGTVGAQTSSQIGSEAGQAAAESSSANAPLTAFYNAAGSIAKAFSGFTLPTIGGSSGAGVAAPNAGSFGSWGSSSSSSPSTGSSSAPTTSSSAGPGGFLAGNFGSSDPADEPAWLFSAPVSTAPTQLSGGNALRQTAYMGLFSWLFGGDDTSSQTNANQGALASQQQQTQAQILTAQQANDATINRDLGTGAALPQPAAMPSVSSVLGPSEDALLGSLTLGNQATAETEAAAAVDPNEVGILNTFATSAGTSSSAIAAQTSALAEQMAQEVDGGGQGIAQPLGSQVTSVPAYTTDTTTSAPSSSGPSPVVIVGLLAAAGGGLWWFERGRHKAA